jgi:hypothetical protein
MQTTLYCLVKNGLAAKTAYLTKWEVEKLNYAYAVNGSPLRWRLNV